MALILHLSTYKYLRKYDGEVLMLETASYVAEGDLLSTEQTQSLPKNNFSACQSKFFNEMCHADGSVREEFTKIEECLSDKSLTEIEELSDTAKQHFIDEGITFTVYGKDSSAEQIIPFDFIPRIIEKKQWDILDKGCKQRVKALNAFLHDVYHEQAILNDGIIPKEQVLQHEAYQPWMLNFPLKGKIYSNISGIDIIRDGAGDFYVLEDNLRTPSGVSYMLESRKISEKIIPELCQTYQPLAIHQYPQLLKQTLIESTDVDQPLIVVLTPGHFNSAYYEHAFLAREMDVPLVGANDLFVENGKVYLKSIQGRKQVDVIYRRLDDDFLDPLAFRADSVLGVPGLMSAYRNRSVVIANAPGTGIADDKSIYPYVDDMIRYYLNEKPILKNV